VDLDRLSPLKLFFKWDLCEIKAVHYAVIDCLNYLSAGGIKRTYKSTFNRAKEETGFGYWI